MVSFAGVLVYMCFSLSVPSAQHSLHLFGFSVLTGVDMDGTKSCFAYFRDKLLVDANLWLEFARQMMFPSFLLASSCFLEQGVTLRPLK